MVGVERPFMPTWGLKLVYETSCRHKVPLGIIHPNTTLFPPIPWWKQLWPSGAIFSCSHYLRGRNSWRNSWQLILCSIVDNTTHDDILWCTILAQVNTGRCFRMVVHWNPNWNLRMRPKKVSSKPLSRDLFYNMHLITIIVYGLGPSVAWAPCHMKILTLIQSSKATFTFYRKIYLILISSKSNTFYCTCYLLYMVYELVSKLARDESIWRNLGRVLHIANMETNELTSHCMGKTDHNPN